MTDIMARRRTPSPYPERNDHTRQPRGGQAEVRRRVRQPATEWDGLRRVPLRLGTSYHQRVQGQARPKRSESTRGDSPQHVLSEQPDPRQGPVLRVHSRVASVELPRARVAEGTALVDIQKGQYTLWGVDGVSRTSRSGVNGLFQLAEGNVLVLTGTKDGPLRLTVETHSQEPPLKLEGWKDIVEVTQRSTTDEVAVAPLFEAPVEGLPKLKVSAGSAIRIRIHARGRDEADKYWGVDEPIEEHLLQMWPAPEADDICHRLSDGFGEVMRSQWSASQ